MHHWTALEAERAFNSASRARRRAAIAVRLRRLGRTVCGLPVYDEFSLRRSGEYGVREIRLECISGTTEPNRAAEFDQHFRPSPRTRRRWERVWMAFHRGVSLPPISVIAVSDGYAIRDGHHRVSVAKALGAPTISAHVAG
jgi:hypothetical protein